MAAAPLDGINVVDLGWLMVGPESGKCLADLGANVVKVESSVRRDPLRSLGPFKDGKNGPNRSISYHAINAGKRSILLDLKNARGREVFLRLVQWADILIESFTPGVVQSLGLSYEELRPINPRLIMVSTSILGQKGPFTRGMSGTGTTGSAFAGANYLVGWPDRMPRGPYGPWTDAVAPRFVVAGILAALHRRRQSGTGCRIDAAQAECGLQFLSPAYFEYAVNGRIPERRGVAGSPLRCPSGVYPCAGADRWVAIDASIGAQWLALRHVIGEPLLPRRFDTLVDRLRNRAEIEDAIAVWTRQQSAQAVEDILQAKGVAAHALSTPQELARDMDLVHQQYHRTIEAPEIEEAVIRGPVARLSRTPHVKTRAGPQMGDATHEILRTICGYSQEQIDELERLAVLR